MNSSLRHVSSSDGQDWLLNEANCKIPKIIPNIKEAYGITIRICNALRPGATAFRDFDSSKVAALWEIIFQQFLFLGYTLNQYLEKILARTSIQDTDILQFYMEPVLDEEKFIEDITTPYCKTSAVAYTFWIFIKDIGRVDVNLDVDAIYESILNSSIKFSKKLFGENASIAATIIKKIEAAFNGMDDDDEDEEDGQKKKRKKTEKQITVKDVPRHERWKLLANKGMMSYIFDMMAHSEEWQTQRLDENINSMRNSPAEARTIFNIYTALYSRPTTCIKNQGIFAMDKMFRKNPKTNLYSVYFPMRKHVLKIPRSLFSIQDIINRKLPLYQLNTVSSVSNMLPIILDDLESKLEDSEKLQEMASRGIIQEKEKSAWTAHYDEYVNTIKYLYKEDDEIVEEDFDSTDQFKSKAVFLRLRGELPEDPMDAVACVANGLADDDIMVRDINTKNATKAFKALQQRAKNCGISGIFDNVINKRGGRINKLVRSQLDNCTTLWPEGTDTRDNTQGDNYQFISIYAILAAQNKAGRTAINNMIKRFNESRDLMYREECSRKLLIMLKKHMLKEYVTKCLSKDAYGISIYEKEAILYTLNEKPFEVKRMHFKFDKSLSVFANAECRTYMKMQSVIQIATLQREFNLLLKYAVDGWRLEYDLHLNSILCSPGGGTGKSNLQSELEQCCIHGTVITEGYTSAKSNATNVRNNNGGKKIWPELQPSTINDKDPNNEKARMFKDASTSGRFTATRLDKNPQTGAYESQHIDSHHICSISGSTNINPYDMSDPMKSRFHIMVVNKRINPFRSINDAKTAQILEGDRIDPQKEEFRELCRFMDCMIFHIERMIYVGILDTPSWDIAWIFTTILSRRLKERGIGFDDVRVNYCINVVARQNLIRDCIEKLWLQKGAKYNGMTITFDQFLDLDPMLAIHTEHIVSAIGECYDRIINPAADTVRKCIKSLFKSAERCTRFRVHVKNTKKKAKSGNRLFSFDYNWIRFPINGKADVFYTKICNESYRYEDGIILTKEAVKEVVSQWSKCKVESSHWAIDGDNEKEDPRDIDDRPEEIDLSRVLVDKKIEPKKQSLVTIAGNNIYFLYEYFKVEDPESSLTTLKKTVVEVLSCAHQLEGKYIFNNNEKYPFVRDIIEVTEIGDNLLAMPTPNFMKDYIKTVLQECDPYSDKLGDDLMDMDQNKRAHAVYAIGEDLNSYSIRRRNNRLHITHQKIDVSYAANFNLFSGTVRRNLDTKNMSDVEKSAIPFLEDNDYNMNGSGYFMGEPLEHITADENVFDYEVIEKNLNSFYNTLDRVDEFGDDHDFKPEDYLVAEYPSMDDDMVIKKYHWDYFEDTELDNPEAYKLMRFHPKIVEDLFNRKTELLQIDECIYPDGVIETYNKAKMIQDSALDSIWVRKDGTIHSPTPDIFVDGFNRVAGGNGVKDYSGVYGAVGKIFGKKNQPKPKNKRKRRPDTPRSRYNAVCDIIGKRMDTD